MTYKLIRSNRKTIAIEVHPDGILVRAPFLATISQIENFLTSRADWIKKAQLKIAAAPTPPPVENPLSMEEIRELEYLESTLFISFSWENMVDLREMLPEQKMQFLIVEWADDLPARLKNHRLDLDIYHGSLTEERIELLHDLGIEVNCWTCDDPDRAEELISWGIDYITTNILE